MQCIKFLEQKERAANGDKNLTTLRIWKGKSIGLVAAVTTLT